MDITYSTGVVPLIRIAYIDHSEGTSHCVYSNNFVPAAVRETVPTKLPFSDVDGLGHCSTLEDCIITLYHPD